MNRYRFIRVAFVSRLSLGRQPRKVEPLHEESCKVYTNLLPHQNSPVASASPIDLAEDPWISKDQDQKNQLLTVSTLSSNKNIQINSPTIEKKKNFHKGFIIPLGIILTLLALVVIGVCIYFFIIIGAKTTTTTTGTNTTAITAITTSTGTTTTFTACTPILYSASFVSGVVTSSQCTNWTSFQTSLSCLNYTSFTLSGSYDTIGITVTNQTTVNAIAAALRTSTAYTGISNGITWSVGTCGSGIELSETNTICQCSTTYTIRPCIGNGNWGGINRTGCGSPSQVMTVSFQ
ncbi:unnamed protein product [Adineta steineri]|uniref:Uncharacterized protein n=2 Tax=Adineta steineri TaxID=433720 RepID=A0A813T9C4_9BILA|nr:unnamed protein product [Adineta steineri]CAF3803068.1 unnamed protein product [Adineta steineri]